MSNYRELAAELEAEGLAPVGRIAGRDLTEGHVGAEVLVIGGEWWGWETFRGRIGVRPEPLEMSGWHETIGLSQDPRLGIDAIGLDEIVEFWEAVA